MNSVVVTVLYLLQALHRRIIVYRIIIVKNSTNKSESSDGIYDDKQSDCLLSRSQGTIGLYYYVRDLEPLCAG